MQNRIFQIFRNTEPCVRLFFESYTYSYLLLTEVAMPPIWPSQGRIELQNVSLRYAPDESPVLKNLNITIESGWKVNIFTL